MKNNNDITHFIAKEIDTALVAEKKLESGLSKKYYEKICNKLVKSLEKEIIWSVQDSLDAIIENLNGEEENADISNSTILSDFQASKDSKTFSDLATKNENKLNEIGKIINGKVSNAVDVTLGHIKNKDLKGAMSDILHQDVSKWLGIKIKEEIQSIISSDVILVQNKKTSGVEAPFAKASGDIAPVDRQEVKRLWNESLKTNQNTFWKQRM